MDERSSSREDTVSSEQTTADGLDKETLIKKVAQRVWELWREDLRIENERRGRREQW